MHFNPNLEQDLNAENNIKRNKEKKIPEKFSDVRNELATDKYFDAVDFCLDWKYK